MLSHLILDFRERSLFALIAAADGSVFPCVFEENGVSTRYLSCDVLLEHGAAEQDDFDWDEVGDLLATATEKNLFSRGRRLGLRRPWASKTGPEAVRLRHPLWALSSLEALGREARETPLARVAATLTAALLHPLFSALSRQGLTAQDLQVVAIVPPCFARSARLVLQKLFSARGFPSLTFFPRDFAAAMLLEEGGALWKALVVDVDEEDLHLRSVEVESDGQIRIYRATEAHAVAGAGWSHWVRRLMEALHASERLSDPAAVSVTELDRAWSGLAGGPYPAEIPGDPPLRITQGLLTDLLAGDFGESLRNDLRRFLPARETDEPEQRSVVALGASCTALALQDLLLEAVAGRQPAEVGQVAALERCARGVAATLRWLEEDPRHRIFFQSASTLRINNLRGECLELVPADALPRAPGERGRIKRLLHLEGEPGEHGELFVNLLWGNSREPEGNRQVCVLPLDCGRDGARTLELTIHLRRSRNGKHLRGSVQAAVGALSVTGRLHLDGEVQRFSFS